MSDLADYADAAPAARHAGAVLRGAREARRLSVEDVAQALKLTPRQIAAIENEEFDLLPGNTFARGFVRNYARLLQLDPGPLLAAVELRLAGGEVDLRPLSNAAGRMPVGTPRRGVPRLLLAGLVFAILALAAGVYLDRFGPDLGAWQSARRAESQSGSPAVVAEPGAQSVDLAARAVVSPDPVAAPIGAVPAATAQAGPSAGDAPAAPVSIAASVSPSALAEPPAQATAGPVQRRLAFRFGKDAWVEVKDGAGKNLVSRLNPAGSVLEVEGQGPFALVVGNAASVELKLDGRVVDLKPHTSVTVARLRLE